MKKTLILVFSSLLITASSFAGNKDRIGEAGATQLNINPWASSSALANSGTANVTGVEALSLNVAGLAFINKTEISLCRTTWLSGSGINISTLGFAQKIGESSVLGINVSSMSFGDIEITTVNLPEGGKLGTFSPSLMNLGLSFAKAFSNSIYGGMTVRLINEQITNAGSRGVALDAGIRYVTGLHDRIKFGISLRNVGPKLKYTGDGFSQRVIYNGIETTVEQRSQGFELPALLNIGGSYDFHLGERMDSLSKKMKSMHILTLSGNFLSNSFGKDQFMIGTEYGFKDLVKFRLGYAFEQGASIQTDQSKDLTNAYKGPSGGLGMKLPLNKISGSFFGIDYSYRPTVSFAGTHSISLKLSL